MSTDGRRVISYDEWANEKGMLTTREDLVAYSQFQLREQIMPLVAQAIRAYEHARKRRAWFRRLFYWVGEHVMRMPPAPTMAEDYLEQQRQEIADALAGNEGEAPPAPVEGEPRAKSFCVTCGSHKFGPVNNRGGVRCENGHVVVEPPPEAAGAINPGKDVQP